MQHLVQQAPLARQPTYEPAVAQARHAGPGAGHALNAGAGVHSLMQLQGMLNRRPAVVAQMQLARDLSRRADHSRPPAPIQRAASRPARSGSDTVQRVVDTLSAAQVQDVIRHAQFRHGGIEAQKIGEALRGAEHQGTVDLPALLEQLRSGNKPQQRTAHLLELTVNDLEASEGKQGDESWTMFNEVARFILTYAGSFNKEQQGGALSDIYSVLDADRSTWNAAAVAALRNGALDATGFEYLADLLFTLTGLALLDERSPAVKHELALQSGLYNPGAKTGTALHPSYQQLGQGSTAEITSGLNKKSSTFDKYFQSGAYVQEGSLITKTLDLGHTAVDKYENIMDRNKETVAPDTKFNYLALLSPNGRQQAIGANGAVLGDGSYMFVVDRQFRFRYMPAANYVGEGGTAKNFVQFIPHSQLAGRADVLGAGNFVIRNGHFVWIDNGSGHYRVDAGLNEANVSASLTALGYDVSDIDFLSRGAGDLDAIYAKGNEILDPLHDARPGATQEIRSMEAAMRTLIPHDGPKMKAKAKQPESGIEMTNIPIKIERQPRVPKGVMIDPVYGQNEKLTEHIGNDQL